MVYSCVFKCLQHVLTFTFALCMYPWSNVSKLNFESATFASNNCKALEIHKMHSDTLLN